jgi:cell division septation protein DedD
MKDRSRHWGTWLSAGVAVVLLPSVLRSQSIHHSGQVLVPASPAGHACPMLPGVTHEAPGEIRSTTLAKRVADGRTSGGARTTVSKRPAVPAPHNTSRRRNWTVQVASYETLDQAQSLQLSLCRRGYDTRVLGAVRPFVVRVGRFQTSDSAMAIARRLQSKDWTVFVTQDVGR